MANTTYTPGEAAESLGITAQSVRRYCGRFFAHLSPGASPAKGVARVLTISDLYKLRQVNEWTAQGKTYEEIDGLLDTLIVPDDAALAPTEPNIQETLPAMIPEGLAILQRVDQSLQAVATQTTQLSALTTITDRHTQEITRLTDELKNIKANRDRRTVFAVTALPWLVVAIIGLVLAVLLLVFMR